MKTIIIEDEKPSARRLKRMLNNINVEVSSLLHSVEEAVYWFETHEHPDFIFLDIQLSDGLSFEIFEQVSVNSAIIFTTAYDAYALQAFKFNSIDYLLKPIDPTELKQAIDKFKTHHLNRKSVTVDYNTIKNLFIKPDTPHYKKRFSIKVGQHLKLITTADIECFYSENKGTYLFTTSGRNYLLDCTMEQLELVLDPSHFFRINRTFYVNIQAINDMVSYSNSRVKIILHSFKNQDLIVARERVKAFKTWLG